ncbi:MAG TPA: hypothetical protein VIQ11_16575, partial [Mycobacterium sp.]
IDDVIDEGFEALHAGKKMKVLVDPTNSAGVDPTNSAGVDPTNSAGVDPTNSAGVDPNGAQA